MVMPGLTVVHLQVESSVRLATFRKEEAHKAEELGWRNLSDVTIRRQFQLLTNIGPSAMADPAKFERVLYDLK